MNYSGEIRLVIIDDHVLFREGLKSIFATEKDMQVVGEADDGDSGLEIVGKTKPDIVLLDIGIPGISGLEVCRQIVAKYEDVKVIMLTMYKSEKYISKAFSAGAMGYVTKQGVVDELTIGIRAVQAGKQFLCSDLTEKVMDKYTRRGEKDHHEPIKSKLTDREIEIVRLLAQGWDNQQIGKALYISPTTVKTHRARIMKKLDIHSAGEMVKYALKTGIIELE